MTTNPAPDSFSITEQLAQRVLDAFEREFWSGRHCRGSLAASPLVALLDILPPMPEPPLPPQAPLPDSEHQRLYDDAARSWCAGDAIHRCLRSIADQLRDPQRLGL